MTPTPGAAIRLSGHLDVPLDRIEAVMAALPAHIRLTRAEPGCLRFDVTPHPAMPGRLVVRELFASRAAFEAHRERIRASHWERVTSGIPRFYDVEEGA